MKLTALIPMLSVSDLKRTMSFYGERLGFGVLNSFGDPEPRWCMLGRDGVRIMFNQPPQDETGPRFHNGPRIFRFSTSIQTMSRPCTLRWKSAGLSVSELRVTDYRMKEFELRDPDGYWLWFGQETSDPPTGNT